MVALAAGVRRLLLTHLHPDADPELAASRAAGEHSGPVEVAQPGQVYDLTDFRWGTGSPAGARPGWRPRAAGTPG